MEEKRRNLLRKSLQLNHTSSIELWEKEKLMVSLLDLIEYDLKEFNPLENYEYLLRTIPLLYQCEAVDTKKIEKIRTILKTILKKKATHEISLENYEILKKIIGKLEILSLTVDKEESSLKKYELLHYLVFSIKNLTVLKNILKKDKTQLNILDSQGLMFLKEVIEGYLEVLEKHVESEQLEYLDDLIYYDRVIALILNQNQDNMTEEIAELLSQKFQNAKKKTFLNSFLQERFYYFIYKWEECFLKYLNNPSQKIEVPKVYEKKELMYQYQVNPSFSPAIEQEAKIIIHQNKYHSLLQELPKIYTVDGEDAEELDDGFSCTKNNGIYRLGIHITNPLLYMEENSLTFKEATNRVSSIYIEDFIPMFPISLATGLFSLNKDQVRLATSLYTTIDLENQNILKFEPIFEPVYVAMNDTYSSCNYTLNMEVGKKEYVETLCNIKELVPFLKTFYNIDDIYKKLNRSEFNVTSTNIIGESKSEKMVEALMIFTNHMYAKYCLENHIPCLFRNHEMTPFYKKDLENYRELLKSESNSATYLNETSILESNYPRSFYGVTNLGHFGLGTTCYTHFTSPDRRIPDCYNALMLKKFIEGMNDTEKRKEIERLNQIATYMNQRNNSIRLFMKEYNLSRKKRKIETHDM